MTGKPMVGFGEAIGLFYRNYVNFEGRATRSEYWWVFLMQLIVYVGVITAMVMMVAGGQSEDPSPAFIALVIALVIFALINFLPGLSLAVRRFHDLDQTGWLVLVFMLAGMVIPGAGLAQMIWFAVSGTQGPIKYGPDPLAYDAEVFG